MTEILFLIPAYQPGPVLADLARELRRLAVSGIVIVDDGSGPAFQPLFRQVADTVPGVTLLAHAANRGKGAALKTGLAHAAALPGVAGVVTLDADGQHRAFDAAAIAALLTGEGLAGGGQEALILGCRAFDAPRMPLRSRLGNLATRHVFRLLTGVALSDAQTGLRGIPAGLIARLLELPSGGYEFETDMLLTAVDAGLPIHPLPIPTLYLDGNAGSHFRPIRDSLRIYRLLLRYALINRDPAARRGEPAR